MFRHNVMGGVLLRYFKTRRKGPNTMPTDSRGHCTAFVARPASSQTRESRSVQCSRKVCDGKTLCWQHSGRGRCSQHRASPKPRRAISGTKKSKPASPRLQSPARVRPVPPRARQMTSLLASAGHALTDSEREIMVSVHADLREEILALRRKYGGRLTRAEHLVLESLPPYFETRVTIGEWVHIFHQSADGTHCRKTDSFRTTSQRSTPPQRAAGSPD